jgi:hypothetical protein
MPASSAMVRLGLPFRVSPSAAISTSTSVFASPFDDTTTPASSASPARMILGNAGLAISGRLAVTRASPYPKRSSFAAVTAMIRYVVSESGSLNVASTRPFSFGDKRPPRNTRSP